MELLGRLVRLHPHTLTLLSFSQYSATVHENVTYHTTRPAKPTHPTNLNRVRLPAGEQDSAELRASPQNRQFSARVAKSSALADALK